MSKLPRFVLYGEGDSGVERTLQPSLALRQWRDLSEQDKQVALREMNNKEWFGEYSREVLVAVDYLNHVLLRQCPGKKLHSIKLVAADAYRGDHSERMKAARADFTHIFLNEKSDAMVYRMLSKFASCTY